MSAFRGNFKFGNGTNANRILANNEITVPPTKNCFIHFPVRSQSEDDDLLDKYISRSCPASGLLDCDPNRNNGTVEVTQTTVMEPTSAVTTHTEEANTFPIALEISSNEPEGRLGLSVDYSSGREVRITAIEQGLIQEWNRMHSNRGERLVNIGDVIVSINGINDPVKMLQECRQQTPYVVEVIIKPLEQNRDPETAAKNGSAGHNHGICRPCAYYHKPNGCVNIQNCSYCHVCPAGELKRRKQVKMFFRKMMYKIQRQQSGDASQDQLQDQDKC